MKALKTVLAVFLLTLGLINCSSAAQRSVGAATPVHSDPVRPLHAQPCSTQALWANAGLQGATGSMLGVVIFKNRSSTPCSISAPIHVRFLDPGNRPLQIQQQARPNSWGDYARYLVLLPSEYADASLQWFNWCHPFTGPDRVALTFASGVKIESQIQTGPPRCDGGSGSASLMDVICCERYNATNSILVPQNKSSTPTSAKK